MSGVCNNDANSCKAQGKYGRCQIKATYGALCHRHARMVCSKAGNLFGFQKLMKTTMRDCTLEEVQDSVKKYTENDKLVDKPRKPIAFSEAVYNRMTKINGWIPITTIAEWLTEWTGREVNSRQAGQAIRLLNAQGLIERDMRSLDGGKVLTLWRIV